ncbi:MAG: Lar family restriction alleviation protein [Ruminococcus sp.]|nr:Lar family restriction alleviation protein [Ruminococcus sp.]
MENTSNEKSENICIIDTDMLKLCPWCGGKPIIHSEKVSNYRGRIGFNLTLECGECGSELRKQEIGGLYFEFSEDGFLTIVNEDIDKMIEQWNRRTQND